MPKIECFTEESANKLKRQIDAYWKREGFDVDAKVKKDGNDSVVRSTLVNGMPVGKSASPPTKPRKRKKNDPG